MQPCVREGVKTMANYMRTAAVLSLVGKGRQEFFSEELLFKPLIRWLADALSRSGVDELLLIAGHESEETLNFGHKFRTYARTDAKGFRGAVRGLASNGNTNVLLITASVIFDEALIAEAITTLSSRTRVMLTSGGNPLGICGLSGEDACDPQRLEALIADPGNCEGFYELDCLDTGSFGAAIETPEDVCHAEELLRDMVNRRHMLNGVRFIGADTIFISPDAEIGEGSVILPNTIIRGETRIGKDCRLGPNSMIFNCTVGDGTEINASQINESEIGAGVHIGPFAYIRPGCQLGDNIRIGDFVELKKTKIDDGTKISHLTYVGDAEVGKNVNFGCGTVTANYDGIAKHLTVIEDGAFIGCNTNLIAPVRIGKNATTAAGTTVTSDVPEGSLAIGRVRQSIKPDWNRNPKK